MTAPVAHELAVAEVVKVVTRGAVRAVRVRCPFCARRRLAMGLTDGRRAPRPLPPAER